MQVSYRRIILIKCCHFPREKNSAEQGRDGNFDSFRQDNARHSVPSRSAEDKAIRNSVQNHFAEDKTAKNSVPNHFAVLWNRNYFLRFRFQLLKSYGSGSGSDF
jgi:hypothetical protein